MNFDIEGMGRARRALTELAQKPKGNNRSSIYQRVINELYSEIRAARIAGYSWKAISQTLAQHMRVSIGAPSICRVFRQIDAQYARETDVPALEPVETRGRKAEK